MNVIQMLEKGMTVTKLKRNGKDMHSLRLYLEKEKEKEASWLIRWDTKKLFNAQSAHLRLSECSLKRGLKSSNDILKVATGFTLSAPKRDLEIVCTTAEDRETWIDALVALGCPLRFSLDALESSSENSDPSSSSDLNGLPAAPVAMEASVVAAAEASVGGGELPPVYSFAQAGRRISGPPPLHKLAVAMHNWHSGEEGDLEFDKDDQIDVTQSSPEMAWFSGSNLSKPGNKPGIFPANYVKIVSVAPTKQGVALFDFTSMQHGDLPMAMKGDRLDVLKSGPESQFFTVTNYTRGGTGTIPGSFVKVVP